MTRLIDADTLKATVMSKADSMEDLWDTAGVLNAINNAPTVEERPHGKWIFEEHGYLICSNCGYDCSHDEEGSYIRGSYCYNCGADMRGDDYGS